MNTPNYKIQNNKQFGSGNVERDHTIALIDAETGLLRKEIILDRLNMNLAFCQRYHMSVAICYMRLILPNELNINTDKEIVHYLKKTFVGRLTDAIREIDSIGIMNETDILLILTDVNENESKEIVKRILNLISGSYTYKNRQFTINISMGICIYPISGNNIEELINNAKMEMYNAFDIGSSKYSFFNGNINDLAYRKFLIEKDLNYAIRLNQFKVLYQPQLNTNTRKIIGVEVLIRWNHPQIGNVSPDEFIPIADSTGKSTEIFYWVLEEVCQHINQLKKRNFPNLKYSINLSIHQLTFPNFVESVNQICINYGIHPGLLAFEITENIQLYKEQLLINTIKSLRKLDFNIGLDDFGNGYFSFTNFITLPINFVKLDKNFVTSLVNNNQISLVISPIINMAHNLKLAVVIEGIETKQQFNEWCQLKCDIIQGYLISKPVEYTKLESSIHGIEKLVESF